MDIKTLLELAGVDTSTGKAKLLCEEESFYKKEKTESKCANCGKTKAMGHHWDDVSKSYRCEDGKQFSRKSSVEESSQKETECANCGKPRTQGHRWNDLTMKLHCEDGGKQFSPKSSELK
jgi:uncharacterized protein with PIN domain